MSEYDMAAKFTAEDLAEMREYGLTVVECTQCTNKLAKLTGMPVEAADYIAWYSGAGSGDSDRFDKAARKLLGEGLYDAADATARLDNVLLAKLDGKKIVTVGGITFKLTGTGPS